MVKFAPIATLCHVEVSKFGQIVYASSIVGGFRPFFFLGCARLCILIEGAHPH